MKFSTPTPTPAEGGVHEHAGERNQPGERLQAVVHGR
jgi:hypothetical protein